MDGAWVVVGPPGGVGEGRVGATNIGRLRPQGKAARGGGITSWDLRVFAGVVGFLGCLLLAASLLMSAVHQVQFRNGAIAVNFRGLQVRTFALLPIEFRIASSDRDHVYLSDRLCLSSEFEFVF
jgi:hypothetical protein